MVVYELMESVGVLFFVVGQIVHECMRLFNDQFTISDFFHFSPIRPGKHDLSKKVGFSVKEVVDRSGEIKPNLSRLQKLARGYFKYWPLSKVFSAVLPDKLLANSVAGLLLPI